MRILVVDDEEAIVEIIASMLTTDGHFVETATNGNDAFRVYCEYFSEGQPFDFVLAGLLPGMGGSELIEAIGKKNPKQRWGFCTSHRVLLKPFDRAELLAFIHQR